MAYGFLINEHRHFTTNMNTHFVRLKVDIAKKGSYSVGHFGKQAATEVKGQIRDGPIAFFFLLKAFSYCVPNSMLLSQFLHEIAPICLTVAVRPERKGEGCTPFLHGLYGNGDQYVHFIQLEGGRSWGRSHPSSTIAS